MSVEHLATASYSWQQTAVNLVVNDNGSWAMVWDTMICRASCAPGFVEPRVDFSRTTVFAVFSGSAPYNSWANITRIVGTILGLTVQATITVVGPNCPPYFFLQPGGKSGGFDIVGIPKTTERVSFSVQTLFNGCQFAV